MRTSKELKEIWQLLQDGREFYRISYYPDGEKYHDTVLFVGYSTRRVDYGTEYIYWKHYGASANENTISNLYWTITTIFGCTPKEFLAKYKYE